MMHTYKQISNKEWQVGYWATTLSQHAVPLAEWYMLSTHATEKQAMLRVNALNGGDGAPNLHQ